MYTTQLTLIQVFSGELGTALILEKTDSVITQLLEIIAIIGIPDQIKTDNGPVYVSKIIKVFCLLWYKAYYNNTTQSYRSGGCRKVKSNYEYVKQTERDGQYH